MSWSDSFDVEFSWDVSSQFQYFSSHVFDDCSAVDSSSSSYSILGGNTLLQESVDSSDWELIVTRVRNNLPSSIHKPGYILSKRYRSWTWVRKLTLHRPQKGKKRNFAYLKPSSLWSALWCSLALSGTNFSSFSTFSSFSSSLISQKQSLTIFFYRKFFFQLEII